MKTQPYPFGKADHIKVIKEIAIGLKAVGKLGNYLEIGIAQGNCFNKIALLAETAYAIEVNIKWLKGINHNSNLVWHHGNTNSFFEEYKSIDFDLIFIDADHYYSSVLNDFRNCFPHLKYGGLILLHDTHPYNQYCLERYCHDCFKVPQWIKENYNKECEIATLPIYHGISIVRKINYKKQLNWA